MSPEQRYIKPGAMRLKDVKSHLIRHAVNFTVNFEFAWLRSRDPVFRTWYDAPVLNVNEPNFGLMTYVYLSDEES